MWETGEKVLKSKDNKSFCLVIALVKAVKRGLRKFYQQIAVSNTISLVNGLN